MNLNTKKVAFKTKTTKSNWKIQESVTNGHTENFCAYFLTVFPNKKEFFDLRTKSLHLSMTTGFYSYYLVLFVQIRENLENQTPSYYD